MTTPTPRRLRRPRLPAVPPRPSNRAPIPADTLRAAYDAHQGSAHNGRPGRYCHTCDRYADALTAARAAELTAPPPTPATPPTTHPTP